MNFLIIGVLLVIAVAAIVGAILLARSEPHHASTSMATPPTVMSTPVRVGGPAASTPAPARPTVRLTHEDTLPPYREEPQVAALNGQFHELAVELRTLYQHAWELEQRLRILTETADRLEASQGNNVGTGEGLHSPTGNL